MEGREKNKKTFYAVNFVESSNSKFCTKKGRHFEWDKCKITELKQPPRYVIPQLDNVAP